MPRFQSQTMKRITITPVILILTTAILCSCKERGSPAGAGSSPVTPDQSPSDTPTYPRIHEKYFDGGREVEGSSPVSVPVAPKVLSVMEGMFRQRHFEINDAENPSTFGVQRDERNSLMVEFSPNPSDGSRTMIAVWRQVEKNGGSSKILKRRSSQPLATDTQALAILGSYASGNDEFETMIDWTLEQDVSHEPH